MPFAIFGNYVLHTSILHKNTGVPELELTGPDNNISIGFYSGTGQFITSISTTEDKSSFLNFELVQSENGSLESFTFTVPRNTGIPFYVTIECRFEINNVWLASGELLINPEEINDTVKYTYTGKGFDKYLKGDKFTKTYLNTSISDIVDDIINTFVIADTPILFDAELIDLPNTIIAELQFKNTTVKNALEEIKHFLNLDPTIYYAFGVNKEKYFYFAYTDNSILRNYHQDFDFTELTSEEDIDKLVNSVIVKKKNSIDESTIEVGTLTDSDSVNKYGLVEKELVIPYFLDDLTALTIGQSFLNNNAKPQQKLEIKEVTLFNRSEFLPLGFYRITGRLQDYSFLASDFESLNEWTLNGINTTIELNNTDVFTGKSSLQVNLNNSNLEYIEHNLEETIFFISSLSFAVKQNLNTAVFKIILYDDKGNNQEFSPAIKLLGDYFVLDLPGITLFSIAKIRIQFLTNQETTLLFDRLILKGYCHKSNCLLLKRVTYNLTGTNFIADIELGSKADSILDNIKEIKEDNELLFTLT